MNANTCTKAWTTAEKLHTEQRITDATQVHFQGCHPEMFFSADGGGFGHGEFTSLKSVRKMIVVAGLDPQPLFLFFLQ